MHFSTLLVLAIVLGLFDSIDPLVFTVLFKIFASKKHVENFLFFIVTYWLLYIVLGIFIIVAGNSLIEYIPNHPDLKIIGKIIFTILGCVFIGYGLKFIFSKTHETSHWNRPVDGYWSALSAILIFFFTIPFAAPFIGLNFLALKWEMPFYECLLIILTYSVALISPFILTLFIYKKHENEEEAVINKLHKIMGNRYVFGFLFILIGCLIIFA